jgi:hypothetical protein
MSMPTPGPTPHPDRGPRADGPHVSEPVGWALVMAFLTFTVLGIILYLLRVSAAAT